MWSDNDWVGKIKGLVLVHLPELESGLIYGSLIGNLTHKLEIV